MANVADRRSPALAGRAALRIVIGMLILVIGLPSGVASAHAIVQTITPGDGSVLLESPDQVVVTFSEPMLPDALIVEVRPGADQPVPTSSAMVDPTDGRRVVIDLGPMEDGSYQVRLIARDAEDLHEVVARTSFAIGDAAPTPSPPIVASYEPVESVARWIFAGGLALLIGVMALRERWAAGVAARPRRVHSLVVAGIALIVLGRLGVLLGRMLSLGGDLGSALATVSRTADAQRLLFVAVALGCVVIDELPNTAPWLDVPVRKAGRLSVRRALGWVGVVNLAVLAAWGSHSALEGPIEPITLLAKTGHLMGLGLWVGVLAVVLVVGAGDAHWRRGLSATSRVAVGGAFLTVASGVVLTSRLIVSLTGLRNTPYGQMLAVKIALVAIAVVLGLAVSRGAKRNWSYLELGALSVVVLIGAAMATATPALDPAFTQGRAAATLVRPATEADDLILQARAIPGHPGANTIELRIAETRRPSLGEVDTVEIEVDGTRYEVTPQDGLAFIEDVILPGGESTLATTVHRVGWADATASLSVVAEPVAYVEPTWISSARMKTPLMLLAAAVALGGLALWWTTRRRDGALKHASVDAEESSDNEDSDAPNLVDV